MCMIVYRPVGKSGRGANIPGSVIDTALRRHPDGFGVAYREAGELRVERFGPAEAKRFRKAVKRVDRAGGEYVAHFRFATHGPKDAAHAHPYEYTHPIDGRVLVFHNGVIDIATTPAESDTEVFVRDVLAHLPSRWWESAAHMFLVTEAIGWSKLTVMTREGTYNLHASRGDWDGGIWYSSAHKPTPTTYKAPSKWGGEYGPYGYRPQPSAAQRAVRDVIVAAPTTAIASGRDIDVQTFRHGGHALSSVVYIDRTQDGDYPDGVICDECYTTGDVYVIDGGVYIDMSHKGEVDTREEEVIADA